MIWMDYAASAWIEIKKVDTVRAPNRIIKYANIDVFSVKNKE
jgi:hypothetical protein